MKKSQKQWKMNSFQKSPFGEALLIATKSAVKSVRQFGNQPTEKATTAQKRRCLIKSKCGSFKIGLRFFPLFHVLNINHPLLLAFHTVPLISFSGDVNKKSAIAIKREKFLQFLRHSCSSTKRTPTPPDKDLSLLSLGCCWNVKLGYFHDPEKCPFS